MEAVFDIKFYLNFTIQSFQEYFVLVFLIILLGIVFESFCIRVEFSET